MAMFYGLDLLKAIAVIEIRDVVRRTRYSHTEVLIDYIVLKRGWGRGDGTKNGVRMATAGRRRSCSLQLYDKRTMTTTTTTIDRKIIILYHQPPGLTFLPLVYTCA